MQTYDYASGKWQKVKLLSVDMQAGIAVAEAQHFSTYVVTPDVKVIDLQLSLGGAGTWSLAAAHPDRWAAIVPICGSGDTNKAATIKHLPCWCFIGDKDGVLGNCRTMIKALKDAGGEPRYSEYPYVGHNSWDSAYVTPELYTWLLAQKAK